MYLISSCLKCTILFIFTVDLNQGLEAVHFLIFLFVYIYLYGSMCVLQPQGSKPSHQTQQQACAISRVPEIVFKSLLFLPNL